MAWAAVLAQANGDSPSWSAIILAVLGSSAIGAVVGGFLTTWYRGRIERDEAWRTRRLDAADEFCTAQNAALTAGMRALGGMENRPDEILDESGELVEWASQLRDKFLETREATLATTVRLELLFGPDSRPAEAAWATVLHLREAVNLIARMPNPLLRHQLNPGDHEGISLVARQEGDDAIRAQIDFARAASAMIRGEKPTGEWPWAGYSGARGGFPG
jgi:hypothetical protein